MKEKLFAVFCFVCLFAIRMMAQDTSMACLGTLATISVNTNVPNQSYTEFDIPVPPDGASANCEVYGPCQPKIISYGNPWKIQIKNMYLLDEDMDSSEAFLILCVDKWFNVGTMRYTYSRCDADGQYERCYYLIRLLLYKEI